MSGQTELLKSILKDTDIKDSILIETDPEIDLKQIMPSAEISCIK